MIEFMQRPITMKLWHLALATLLVLLGFVGLAKWIERVEDSTASYSLTDEVDSLRVEIRELGNRIDALE